MGTNILYFMVTPNGGSVPFDEDIPMSAEAINVSTMSVNLVIEHNIAMNVWTVKIGMRYNDVFYTSQKQVMDHAVMDLTKPPKLQAVDMTLAKLVIYGAAPMLAYGPAKNSGLDTNFLITCIRQFAKPKFTLFCDVKNALQNDLAAEAEKLPGSREMVKCPGMGQETPKRGKCNWQQDTELMLVIIHLNDNHKWTREQIADWLDKLYADGVDLAFKDG